MQDCLELCITEYYIIYSLPMTFSAAREALEGSYTAFGGGEEQVVRGVCG